jgi:hypothetical protein
MKFEGRCYCGAIRYQVEGDPIFRVQCHCRECQYIAGGGPNLTIGMGEAGFSYTEGTPKVFRRSDLETPVAREFCAECGTHLVSKAPGLPGVALIKVGTMADPSLFEGPQMAIYTMDQQGFHQIAEGVSSFERMPG